MSAESTLPDLSGRLALRPHEAAAALGISDGKLRQIAPELPRVRRGRTVLYPVAGLEQWLAAQAEAPGQDVDSISDEVVAEMMKED